MCECARGGGGGGQRDINFCCLHFKINEGRGWEREREREKMQKSIRWKYRQVEQHHANLIILIKKDGGKREKKVSRSCYHSKLYLPLRTL